MVGFCQYRAIWFNFLLSLVLTIFQVYIMPSSQITLYSKCPLISTSHIKSGFFCLSFRALHTVDLFSMFMLHHLVNELCPSWPSDRASLLSPVSLARVAPVQPACSSLYLFDTHSSSNVRLWSHRHKSVSGNVSASVDHFLWEVCFLWFNFAFYLVLQSRWLFHMVTSFLNYNKRSLWIELTTFNFLQWLA